MRDNIVMIHGAFCGAWSLDGYRTLFEAHGANVIAPTLRYHDVSPGQKSPQALGTTSILDYASDIEIEVAKLSSPPVLIGHSMGGLIAQIVAQRTPVRALVLLAPSPPWGVLPTSPWEVMSAQGLFLAGQFWNKPLRPEAWVAESHALDLLPKPERDLVFQKFVPESGLATFEILHWGFDLRRSTYVDARKVTCPVLCVAGSLDRVNPPRTVACISRRYRERGEYFEVSNASHWLIGEPGWEKTAEFVREWVYSTTKS